MKSRKEAFEDAISATKAASPRASSPAAAWRCCARSTPSTRGGQGRRRRADRPADPAAGARGADAADRRELRRRRRRGRRTDARRGTGTLGFDAARGKYVDLVEAGIIDPTKVVRVALENAVSVAERAAADRGDADRGARAEGRAGAAGHGLTRLDQACAAQVPDEPLDQGRATGLAWYSAPSALAASTTPSSA